MNRALVVDDEADARSVIRQLIMMMCPQITAVTEAENCRQALTALQDRSYQIVFLDIQLGSKNGIDLAESIREYCSKIVFVTAHAKYAVDAFRTGALHYLVKPISPDALQQAVNRANLSDKREARVYLNTKERTRILRQEDIVYLHGQGNYTSFHTRDGEEHLVSRNLSHHRAALAEERFVLTHQSYLVNISFVVAISASGEAVELSDGQRIPVSRRNREDVRRAVVK